MRSRCSGGTLEGAATAPSYLSDTNLDELYADLMDLYSVDPMILDEGPEQIGASLVAAGFCRRKPEIYWIESCLEMIRAVERM